jgi:hypothetical protein
MSRFSQMIQIAVMVVVVSASPALTQQATPPAPPAATAQPSEPQAPAPQPPAPPVDEAAMTAELKRLYAYPVLANECGYELNDGEFARLDSAIGIAEERSGFAEEKLDDIFNGIEAGLKEDLFKKGLDAACKEQEPVFKAFVTGLPD